MTNILIFGLIGGCLAAWLLTLAGKWGIINFLQTSDKLPMLITKMAGCPFCLSWWTSVAICLAAAVATGDWLLSASVFVSTMVCKRMVEGWLM